MVTAIGPREWERESGRQLPLSAQAIESAFGHDAANSDYRFVKVLYEFTPDNMKPWGMLLATYNRDQFLLIVKSIAISKVGAKGIFNPKSPSNKAFQQANPQAHQDGIAVNL